MGVELTDLVDNILGTVGFLCLVYFGLSYKAYLYTKKEMALKLESGEITEDEHRDFVKKHTFMKTLRNPRYVIAVAVHVPHTR